VVRELVDARMQLVRFGVLLNQAVTKLNATGQVDDALVAAVRRCGGVTRRPGRCGPRPSGWVGSDDGLATDGQPAGARREQDAPVGRVIGRVYRGRKVGGLVRYLYGPDRHNEHQNPHLVASWSGCTQQQLAVVEPEWTGVGERDYRGLVAELEALARYAERGERNPVWHCPLRTAPTDRVLTDGEWAEVDLMHRTGIAPRGDDGGCRWVAVRHDEVSIHVVAVLARQDGARAHPANDWHQVRAACLAAEAGCAGRSSTPPLGRGSRPRFWTGSGSRALWCGSGGNLTAGCPAMPSGAGNQPGRRCCSAAGSSQPT